MSEEIVQLSEQLRDQAEAELQGDDTSDQWKALRQLLKAALLAGEIPIEPSQMKPKEVWTKYINSDAPAMQVVDYADKPVREKYTRLLRSLRKKHKDGDLENEGKNDKPIVWSKSAAKQHLKRFFREKLISVDYSDPLCVWNEHCKNDPAFARMECDSAFVRRLKTVRDDYVKKLGRCEKDLQAYLIAKKNHPTPEFNARGEPQWNGSEAQRLLKEMVRENRHVGVEPKILWEANEAYKVYSLQTFRDHIYQEERLVKFDNYLGMLKKRKLDQLQY